MSAYSYEILETKERLLEDNDQHAKAIQSMLHQKGVFFVNLMSSPGSGKTTTLLQTIQALSSQYRIGVIEADMDSDVDAAAIANTGCPVIQLHTGGCCHMTADMTRRGLERLPLEQLDLVFLENIGNLVCPAEFDTGAHCNVLLLSTPEGDDKPLKYPLMFQVSHLMLVNKMDVASVFDFDIEKATQRARSLNPDLEVLPITAATGEGMEAWFAWLKDHMEAWRKMR